MDKLTILKDAIELQKQNIELTGETQRLKVETGKLRAAIAEKDAVIGRFEAVLKKSPKTVGASALTQDEANALAAALLVEIVALPPNPNVKVSPLTYKGEKVKMEKDEDGFFHFWVPRPFASSLLGSASGMKYALVGPDEKMTVRRFGSSRAVDITVYKHVKAQYPTGGAFWQPVIEEEPDNGGA